MALKPVNHFDQFELDHMLGDDMLELLVDTKEGTVYHVDPAVGHARAASAYLKKPEKQITTLSASHLVSAVVVIKKKIVNEVWIGRSSLEMGCHIKHTRDQLAKAQAIIEELMRLSAQLGEVFIAKDIKEHEIVFKNVA